MKSNSLLEHDLFGRAKPKTFENARLLRNALTEAENLLWHNLRNRKLAGAKFRRQHPMNQFIVDFYCAHSKLALEVDGEIHHSKESSEHDENRTYELEQLGIKVIRFSNNQVLNAIDEVLTEIVKHL